VRRDQVWRRQVWQPPQQLRGCCRRLPYQPYPRVLLLLLMHLLLVHPLAGPALLQLPARRHQRLSACAVAGLCALALSPLLLLLQVRVQLLGLQAACVGGLLHVLLWHPPLERRLHLHQQQQHPPSAAHAALLLLPVAQMAPLRPSLAVAA
jgi:hypothetical protein